MKAKRELLRKNQGSTNSTQPRNPMLILLLALISAVLLYFMNDTSVSR